MAPTGSFVFIPKGTAHTYRNMRKEPGKLLGAVIPGGFEGFFQAAQGVEGGEVVDLFSFGRRSRVGVDRLVPSPVT